jgi:O-antigen ligase
MRPIGRFRPLAPWGLSALAGVALLFGIASAILPAWFVFSVLLVPAVALLMLVRPEYALTACAGFVGGLIHPAFVPRISLFGGELAAADFALAMLAIYGLLALATGPKEASSTPIPGVRFLAVVLALFGVALAFAVVNSLLVLELNPKFVLGQTRGLLYLLLFPIAVVILRSQERQERFVRSLVILGCLFSMGQVMQGIFNVPVFGDQGMSVLETLGREDSNTTRSNTFGLNVIILALLLTVGAYCVGRIRTFVFLGVAGWLALGIALTLGRTTFAVVLVCLTILVWWLNPRRLPQLLAILVIALAAVSAIGMRYRPDSFDSIYFRMTSIGEEIDHGYSAQWRLWEFQAMLPHIQAHPLAGIGLGADYKGLGGSAARPDLNRYMHNAYFYMAGKMGLPALALFVLAMLAILAIGRRAARRHSLPWSRMVGAAGAVMMIRFFLASVTEPHLMSDYGVVVIAICGALVYMGARRRDGSTSPEPGGALHRPPNHPPGTESGRNPNMDLSRLKTR